MAVLRNRPVPVWEYSLLVPYRICRFPFRLAGAGVKETVVLLDEARIPCHLKRILGPQPGPFGSLLTLRAGGLTGIGGGLTVSHRSILGEGNRLKLRTGVSSTGDNLAVLGMRFGVGSEHEIEMAAGHRNRANARYFGPGPRSSRHERTYYRSELSWAGAEIHRNLPGRLSLGFRTLLSWAGAYKPGEGNDPPVSDFASGPPPGYGDRVDGLTWAFSIRRDTTEEEGRPEEGAIYRFRVGRFGAIKESEIGYWTYRAEMERFLPLWFSKRALAVRGFYSWIDPTGADPVPFQQLMTNDDPDLLRGFNDFRWRDRGMLAFSLEYRWPILALRAVDGPGLDAYLLADFGQVFGQREEISRRNMTTSLGGGIRVISWAGFLARAEVARSSEEVVFRLRADQIFQFDRSGLYHGRNPIPIR